MRRRKPTMRAVLLDIADRGCRAARLLFSRNARTHAKAEQAVPGPEIDKWLASPGLRPPM
ncbi:hypothetical protein SAMN05216338_10816 [Bradyrhizobium sp. Rc2d]|nr:hypothetical protein SAMN05216338_10816 [Bradyrhizobium sp. Rc2d]